MNSNYRYAKTATFSRMAGMDGMNISSDEDASLSGAFLGHFIPAVFFIGFGLFLLGFTCRRAMQGRLAIPENDMQILSGIGFVLMACTTLGFLVEAIGGYLAKDNFWFQSAHETLYCLFFFAGVCAFFESKGALPPDSARSGVATALLGEYILWYEHALMKTSMVDQRIHIILANISFSNCAVLLWSIYRGALSPISYILGYAILILQGMWLLTAAFNIGINQENSKTGGFLTHHNVGVIFCIEILSVGFGIVTGTAHVYSRQKEIEAKQLSTSDREASPIVSRTEEYEMLSRLPYAEADLSHFE